MNVMDAPAGSIFRLVRSCDGITTAAKNSLMVKTCTNTSADVAYFYQSRVNSSGSLITRHYWISACNDDCVEYIGRLPTSISATMKINHVWSQERCAQFFDQFTGRSNFQAWLQTMLDTTPTVTGGTTMFEFSYSETIKGFVGQIRYRDDNTIVWESEPFTDKKDEDGKVTITGQQQADKAARDKAKDIVKGLFA